MPPATSLSFQHYKGVGKWPDLREPKTFNEKVLVRKLTDGDPRFVTFSDKVKAKGAVASIIGDKYITPTLWSGTKINDAARSLRGRMVLKANHASNRMIFIKDGGTADWDDIDRKGRAMLTDWTPHVHEPWYNKIERALLIEPFIGGEQSPDDYKFFVFNGVVQMIQVDEGRFSGHTRALMTHDWSMIDGSLKFRRPDKPPKRPKHLDEMLELAKTLGGDFSFVRVDFYDLDDGPRFGEMTFSPGGGIEKFTPHALDQRVGEYWAA